MKKIKIILAIIISAIFLYFILAPVNFDFFLNYIKSIDLGLIIFSILIIFIAEIFRTVRWQTLLSPIKQLPLTKLYSGIIKGNCLNYIFPLRAGELYKALFLNKQFKISKSSGLSIILFERIIDNLALISFFFIFGLLNIKKLTHLSNFIYIIGIIYMTILVIGIVIVCLKNKLLKLLSQLKIIPMPWKKNLLNIIENILIGWEALKHYKKLFKIIFLTYLFWLLIISSTSFVLNACNIMSLVNITLPYDSFFFAMFLWSIIGITSFIPSAPGAIGPYQAACILAIMAFAAQPLLPNSLAYTQAVGFSLILWLRQVVPMIIIGSSLFFLKYKN